MGTFNALVFLGFVLFLVFERYFQKKRIACIMNNASKGIHCKKRLPSLMGTDNLDTVRDTSKTHAFARGTWLL